MVTLNRCNHLLPSGYDCYLCRNEISNCSKKYEIMKKSVFFLLSLFILVGCSKDEPTGQTYSGTTTEPDYKWKPSYMSNGSYVFYNVSKYTTYDVEFGGNTYRLKPGENSGTIEKSPGTYNFVITQYNNFPINGDFKNQKATYKKTVNISANRLDSYSFPLSYSLTISNTDKSHSYYVTLNGSASLPSILVPKGGSVQINNLDAGYYHVFCEQRDYMLWGTNHEYDIAFSKNTVLTIKN